MNRHRLVWLMFAVLLAAPGVAFAGTSVSWNVSIGNAPPPPAIVFHREPRVVVVPGSTVYVLEDDYAYDVFRYGVFWYVYNDGYWYRSRTHRGPFAVVSARYVPNAICNVPGKYWRHPHGGPPGQMKKYKQSGYVAQDVRKDGRKEGRKRKD